MRSRDLWILQRLIPTLSGYSLFVPLIHSLPFSPLFSVPRDWPYERSQWPSSPCGYGFGSDSGRSRQEAEVGGDKGQGTRSLHTSSVNPQFCQWLHSSARGPNLHWGGTPIDLIPCPARLSLRALTESHWCLPGGAPPSGFLYPSPRKWSLRWTPGVCHQFPATNPMGRTSLMLSLTRSLTIQPHTLRDGHAWCFWSLGRQTSGGRPRCPNPSPTRLVRFLQGNRANTKF